MVLRLTASRGDGDLMRIDSPPALPQRRRDLDARTPPTPRRRVFGAASRMLRLARRGRDVVNVKQRARLVRQQTPVQPPQLPPLRLPAAD